MPLSSVRCYLRVFQLLVSHCPTVLLTAQLHCCTVPPSTALLCHCTIGQLALFHYNNCTTLDFTGPLLANSTTALLPTIRLHHCTVSRLCCSTMTAALLHTSQVRCLLHYLLHYCTKLLPNHILFHHCTPLLFRCRAFVVVLLYSIVFVCHASSASASAYFLSHIGGPALRLAAAGCWILFSSVPLLWPHHMGSACHFFCTQAQQLAGERVISRGQSLVLLMVIAKLFKVLGRFQGLLL